MIAAAINTLLGIWLMAAPAVLRYGGLPEDHDRIVGPVIATFAAIAFFEVCRPLRWVTFVGGLWLLAAPWLLSFPADATTNSMIVGLAVAVLSLWKGRTPTRFGGGWSSLWKDTPTPH